MAHALHESSSMQNTTAIITDTIDTNFLAAVSGGCGGHHRRCGNCQQTTIINNNQAPAAAPVLPAPAAPADPGPLVSTNVSVAYH
jgi:hypothetical protein